MTDERDFFGFGPDMDLDGDTDVFDYLIMDDILTQEEKEAEESFSGSEGGLLSDCFDDEEDDEDEDDDEERDGEDGNGHFSGETPDTFQRRSSALKTDPSVKTEYETTFPKPGSNKTENTEADRRISLEKLKNERSILRGSIVISLAVWLGVTLIAGFVAYIVLTIDDTGISSDVVAFFDLIFVGGAILVSFAVGAPVFKGIFSDLEKYETIKEMFYQRATNEELAALKKEKTRRRLGLAVAAVIITSLTVFALVNSGAGGSGESETYNGKTSGSYGIASGKTSEIGAYGSNSGPYYGKTETSAVSNGVKKPVYGSQNSGGDNGAYDPRVAEFSHPDDFYEWYYDDFFDFEEAEDYYYSHGGE